MSFEMAMSPQAKETLQQMCQYIRENHDREDPVVQVEVERVTKTDDPQCIIVFAFKDRLPDGCVTNVEGIDMLTDEDRMEILSGKLLDCKNGQFTLRNIEE